jgi:hypothetical protein
VGLRELFGRLVSYWMDRAKSSDAQPVDLRLMGLIYQYGLGGMDEGRLAVPNPDAADAWFRLAAKERDLARNRAALDRLERGGTVETIDRPEYSEYHPCMFDKELKAHLFAAVDSGSDALGLGLSIDQKEALSRYVIDTFERLLSSSDSSTVPVIHLPETPPERYAARKVREGFERKENIVEFLTRVYAKEIEAGIIADSDISSLDRSAYHALRSWNINHQNKQFHLVKKPEVVEREISERLEALRQAALQQTESGPRVTREQLRQVRRLEGAIRSLLPE